MPNSTISVNPWKPLCVVLPLLLNAVAFGAGGGLPEFAPILKLRGILFPSISPSGHAIAYFLFDTDSESYDLLVYPENGASGRLLADGVFEESNLAWNPDSDSLAVLRSNRDSYELSVDLISIEGEVLSSIGLGESIPEGGLSWLSDGKTLVVGGVNSFLVFDSERGDLLFKIDLEDFGLRSNLTTISVSSADFIAFSATRVGTSDGARIWVLEMSKKPSNPVPVTLGPTDDTPEWVGTSSIIFSREAPGTAWEWGNGDFAVRHLWEVEINSKIEQQLTAGNVVDSSPRWSSNKGIIVYSHIPLTTLSPFDELSTDGKPKKFSESLNEIAVSTTAIIESCRVEWLRLPSD